MRGGPASIGQASHAHSTLRGTASERLGGTVRTTTMPCLSQLTARTGPAPPPECPDADDEDNTSTA
jgi:hypothetical protein